MRDDNLYPIDLAHNYVKIFKEISSSHLAKIRDSNMLRNLQAIVLAAGKSTSFNTDKTKLVEKICGQEMILYTTRLLESLSIETTVVVGYQKELVQAVVTKQHDDRINFIVQQEQQGTAHAIVCAQDSFTQENILIMHGDMPLATADIIEKLYDKHIQSHATVSFIIAHNDDPSGHAYSRVIKQDNSIKVIKAREFDGDINDHCFINAGIYIVTKQFLQDNIQKIEKNHESKEFYFTDIIKMASDQNKKISTIQASFDHIRGIDTFQELWAAEQIKRAELIKHWMDRGVRFSMPQSVHIDLNVTIGAGSFIGGGVHIQRGTTIGKNCTIAEFCNIENSTLEDHVTIYSHCIIKDTHIGTCAKVGPFAHVIEHSTIGAYAIIGNFVEVKRSTIGQHSKAKHLTYLGDAQIGSQVNIGAGTITCNHDGNKKHTTTIKDGAYIGSNNTLVAPVTIEENAFTAAGSTITTLVPKDALAIGRARQVNKLEYALKLRVSKKPVDKESSFVGAVKNKQEKTT